MAGKSLVIRSSLLGRTLLSRPTTLCAVVTSSFQPLFTKTLTISPPPPFPPRYFSSFSSAVAHNVLEDFNTLLDTSRENAQEKLSTFDPSPTSTTIVPLRSEEALKTALKKALDDRLPSVFFFAPSGCFFDPGEGEKYRRTFAVIKELSEKYSHVTTYKADTYRYAFGDTFRKLKTSSRYAFGDEFIKLKTSQTCICFYHNGKKEAEMVGGGDLADLKLTLEDLYKQV